MTLNVLYIDMNSYFASVEQQLRPELRGRPVAVVPVEADTSFCIAASREAKVFGVKTGTRIGDAKRMCPGLACVKGHFEDYVRTHHAILAAVDTRVPVDQVHSIDECSARLLRAQRTREGATALAREIKLAIAERVGAFVTCSIGVAPNRLLAKVAADMQKPDGLTVIDSDELPGRLLTLEPRDLPGVGPRMQARLARSGVTTMAQLLDHDEAGMARLWGGVVGAELYHMLRGREGRRRATVRRSVGHSHVLAPPRRTPEGSREVAVRLLTKVATRARHMGYVAGGLTVGITFMRSRAVSGSGWSPYSWHRRAALGGVNDTLTMLGVFGGLWDQRPTGTPLRVGIVLDDLTAEAFGGAVLFREQSNRDALSRALDRINRRYGADAIYPAAMHGARGSAPRRIAFTHIPDLDVPDVPNDPRG